MIKIDVDGKKNEIVIKEAVSYLNKRRNQIGYKVNKYTRKERGHKLILAGTVFETLGMLEEEREFLIGLLLMNEDLFNMKKERKQLITNIGKKFLDKMKEGE